MQLSQWELLQGTCVNSPAKSILDSLMATNDKKSYDERKSVSLHLQSEVFLRKMLQIQRRKQLKTKRKMCAAVFVFTQAELPLELNRWLHWGSWLTS